MTQEEIIRDAIVCAFLEGGDCAFTAYTMGLADDGKELSAADVDAACEAYVAKALPNIMAEIATLQPKAREE